VSRRLIALQRTVPTVAFWTTILGFTFTAKSALGLSAHFSSQLQNLNPEYRNLEQGELQTIDKSKQELEKPKNPLGHKSYFNILLQ